MGSLVKIIMASLLLLSNLQAKKEKVIAKIPEASGICYSKNSDTLFVVNDEGGLYELSTKGKILKEKKIGKYDLEGITIDENRNLLLLINEKDETILVVDKKSFNLIKKIKINRKYKGKPLLYKGGDGIEGISLYKNKIYASNQSTKPYPKKDSSIIVVLDYDLNKEKLKIKDIINHGFFDIAGLSFYKGYLYMVSDRDNLLIKYNIEENKVERKYKLSKKYDQEGITFDTKGNLYIADDKGRVLKINLKEK